MKVTVILPNYNHAPYLKDRIDSILNQTYRDFELMILDDCSSDNSKDIIEQYRNHPKVCTIIYNKQNSGSTFHQWNKGVSMAKGKYIWLAESDDVAHQCLLETLVGKIETEENIVLAFSQSCGLDSEGNRTNDWIDRTADMAGGELFDNDFIMDGMSFIKRFLIKKNVIPNASAVIFDKDTFLQLGGASANFSYYGDWLIWIKMLTKGKIAYSQCRYNYFRRHAQSVVGKEYSSIDRFVPSKEIHFRINLFPLLSSIKNEDFISLNKNCLEEKSIVAARYLWVNGSKIRSLKYYLLYLRYTSNIKSSIGRTFRFVFNKE